jgi:hypothetical protein
MFFEELFAGVEKLEARTLLSGTGHVHHHHHAAAAPAAVVQSL